MPVLVSGLKPSLAAVLRCPARDCTSVYKGQYRLASLKQHIRRKSQAGNAPSRAAHQEHYTARAPKEKEVQLEMQANRQRLYYEKHRVEIRRKQSLKYYMGVCRRELEQEMEAELKSTMPVPPTSDPELGLFLVPPYGNPFYVMEEDLGQNVGRTKSQLMNTARTMGNVLRQRVEEILQQADLWECDMDIERDVLCFLKYHQALIEEQLRPSFEQRMRQYDWNMRAWEKRCNEDVDERIVAHRALMRVENQRQRRLASAVI